MEREGRYQRRPAATRGSRAARSVDRRVGDAAEGLGTVAAAISEKIIILKPEVTAVPKRNFPMQLKVRISMTVKRIKGRIGERRARAAWC